MLNISVFFSHNASFTLNFFLIRVDGLWIFISYAWYLENTSSNASSHVANNEFSLHFFFNWRPFIVKILMIVKHLKNNNQIIKHCNFLHLLGLHFVYDMRDLYHSSRTTCTLYCTKLIFIQLKLFSSISLFQLLLQSVKFFFLLNGHRSNIL